ncbi:beta-galactosidase [Microcella alkaliphila]|uniref:beta-galactosidase n=1 Tax=Microcella alkaliphila TaxID=279828 RepID=UPI00137474BD|nr:beta-galactosidase [Microcella alkaliphila]
MTHSRVALTREAVLVDGAPALPVSGELHYSRVPRERWEERLRLLRSGGVTIVSSYVFWNHHQPRLDAEPDFDDRLDVAAFVRAAADAGLFVILRIGPWCHGEARYGGLPDEVATAAHPVRTDDPRYLAQVEAWWGALASHLEAVLGPDGPVVGIQIENELVDDPAHIATLAALARRLGLRAAITTATAWLGARLPVDDVMPLYGGYSDGFWVDHDAPWHDTFREHFFFSHVWDDPGIGADVTAQDARPAPPADMPAPGAHYPVATCELGGANPVPVLAADTLEESQRTGYPNDLPRYDYDFHAPIGAAGLATPTHAALRRQHALLEAFGERLTRMSSRLPEVMPTGLDDTTTVRWATRTDGEAALLVISWHQPHEPLPTLVGVQLEVPGGDEGAAGTEPIVTRVPALPVDLPAGTLAHWPVRWPLGALTLGSASASLVTELPGPSPVTVLAAHDGVPVMLEVAAGVALTGDGVDAVCGHPGVWRVDARSSRLLDVTEGDAAGRIVVRSLGGTPSARRFDARAGAWVALPLSGAVGRPVAVSAIAADTGAPVPAGYGARERRAAAPSADERERHAHRWVLSGLDALGPDDDPVLTVDWAGDVAELTVDGRVVLDRFWDGSPWIVRLRDHGWRPGSALEVRVVPLHAAAAVHLPRDAAARRPTAGSEPLVALDAVTCATLGVAVETQ